MAVKGDGKKKRLSLKSTNEEKGPRTERSTNVYLPKKGMKRVRSAKCNLIYQNKRWC